MLGIALGALSGLAATGLGWASMDPQSQFYGRTFAGARGGSRKIALTYDDGPNDPHTLRLLEVLAKHQVRATFFMIGQWVAKRPDIARAVSEAGHEIGNHTWSHPNLIFCSQGRVQREIAETEKALGDAIGAHSTFFRPPFGGRRPSSLRAVGAAGLTPILWNVTSFDWTLTTAQAIEERVWPRLRGGDVVLMHDGGHLEFGTDRSNTVAATDALIRRALGEGYGFCTVGEMMKG